MIDNSNLERSNGIIRIKNKNYLRQWEYMITKWISIAFALDDKWKSSTWWKFYNGLYRIKPID